MEEFGTKSPKDVYEFLLEKGITLEVCDKIEDEEIDGPGFLELTEDDIKKITSKMGLIKKLQRLIREIKGESSANQNTSSPSLISPSPISSPPLISSPPPISPPLFPSPSASGSDDGSSVASSASAMVRTKPGPKGFKIPDLWRPSNMAVINHFSDEDKAKKLSGELRSEITRELVTQMYACAEKIEKPFCTDVAKKLVLKYPFMRDRGEGVCGYGSWEKRIVERVHNTRSSKKRSGDEFDRPPAKRGRPRIDRILDRYPPYESNMEIGDIDHKQEMKDELGDRRRKSVIIPHLKASFSARRDYILSNEGNNDYDEIVSQYPALKEPYALELEFDLILQMKDTVNKAITDWRVKWVPAICSFARSQTSKGVKAVLAQEKKSTGDDKDEKLALKVLCSLLGKKEGLMYLYEECKMNDDIDQIGSRSPLRPNPRFASFTTEGGLTEYVIYVNLKPLCKVSVFARALMLWFVAHYVFHLEYTKEVKEVAYFFQEYVFCSLTKAKKTTTYLSVTTGIQAFAE